MVMIGYFVYSYFQKSAILRGVIHQEAESVLKIGVHDIKKTLVLDALSSPMYYWENAKFSDGKKDNDTIEKPETGIDLLPYSLVFYTMKNVKNTFFTTYKLDDSEAFEKYIAEYLKDKNITISQNEYKYAIDQKSKLLLAWNKEKLAIAFSANLSFENCKQVFDDVLLENKVILDKENAYLKKLSAADSHITYLNNNSEINLNFKEGKAILTGLIYSKTPKLFKKEIKYNATPNASMQLYFDANFSNKENKETVAAVLNDWSFFKKNNIDVSTLTNTMDGVFSMAVKGTTMQSDTIVTYEYDDNFEKIETKAVQEKKAPVIVLNVGSDKKLNSYLLEQGAIENEILKAIPYYIFYTKEDSLNSVFSTVKNEIAIQHKTGSYFFSLDVDFKNLQQDLNIPKADKIVALLETLRINARQLEGNEIELEGKVLAVNPDINIITQLYFGLQEKDTIQY